VKSLLLSEYSHLEVVDLPVPSVEPNEVLVQVEACRICGSDVHGYDGSSGRRIPPIVMGHEAAGTVAAVGSEVKGFSKGERVTFDSTVYCGQCGYCARGEINLCDNRQVVGVSCADYRRSGAFAEYAVVPQHILYHLPETISFADAAMLEAVAVALHAVRISSLTSGETALVIGAGMIGLLTLQAAKAAGCSCVWIADVDETRLDIAKQIGAEEVLHLSGANLIAEVLRLTHGKGVDIVWEETRR
jgi:L-iditol 2-dehydrogenase